MTIAFDFPSHFENELRSRLGRPVDQIAREALICEGYRTGALSLGEVAELLGFPSRIQAENWLAARDVRMNYSLADLQEDRENLKRLTPRAG